MNTRNTCEHGNPIGSRCPRCEAKGAIFGAAVALALVFAGRAEAGTNNILPFATSDSYVMSQSAYAADTQRLSGNVPGTQARADLVNKALRQCSVMSTILGQFMADYGGSDVVDYPGGIGVQVLTLLNAVQTVVPTGSTTSSGKVQLATPTETKNNACPTPGPCTTKAVTPAGLAETTATTGRAGLAKIATSTGNSNDIFNGSDDSKIVTPKGLAARTATALRSGIAELADGSECTAGTDTTRTTTPACVKAYVDGRLDLDSDLSNPGYATLPGGVILQWGSFSTTDDLTQTFPIAFPHVCFNVQLTPTESTERGFGVASCNTTGFTPDTDTGGKTAKYLAVGW